MRKLTTHFIIIFGLLISLEALAQDTKKVYRYLIDLNQAEDNKVRVQLTASDLIMSNEVDFVFPVSVPGFYNNNLQFADLVSNLQALDNQGKKLLLEKKAPNRWTIKGAKSLATIKYALHDMWQVKEQFSHWLPAENILKADTVFLLNHGASLGYFDNWEDFPVEVQLLYPSSLFPASGINYKQSQPGKMMYSAKNYHEMTDSPILFTSIKPLTFKVANTEVNISVYSPNHKVTNEWVEQVIKSILTRIGSYLGKKLPADKYALLIYFYPGPIFASAALEHHNSSVYIYPEEWDANLLGSTLAENLKNTVIHEFFHIIAPLNIHSEELMKFNFTNPKTSQHLWLYEGSTEYLTYHMQVNQKMKPLEVFTKDIEAIIKEMKHYRTDLSLKEVSLQTYGVYAEEYDNVELKGMLVNLLLDIELVELSKGSYNVKKLMLDLASSYGKDKSFKDEELFDVIASKTFPQIRSFFSRYVEGTEKLPIKEYLQKVGLDYREEDNKINIIATPSQQQLNLRQAWLYK